MLPTIFDEAKWTKLLDEAVETRNNPILRLSNFPLEYLWEYLNPLVMVNFPKSFLDFENNSLLHFGRESVVLQQESNWKYEKCS